MTKEEIITEIKKNYAGMNHYMTSGELNNSANRILNLLSQMAELDPSCCSNEMAALFHTINKEVKFTDHYEREMNKKNAAKVRKTEFKDAMDKAIRQIRVDLIGII